MMYYLLQEYKKGRNNDFIKSVEIHSFYCKILTKNAEKHMCIYQIYLQRTIDFTSALLVPKPIKFLQVSHFQPYTVHFQFFLW